MSRAYFYLELDDGSGNDEIIVLDRNTREIQIAKFVGEIEDEVVEPEEDEMDEIIEEPEIVAPPRAQTKKRKQITCGKCGKPGHQARTCTVGEDSLDLLDQDGFGHDGSFEVTEEIKDEINELLFQDKGSRDIAAHYGISVNQANKAIAKAKGIDLPE